MSDFGTVPYVSLMNRFIEKLSTLAQLTAEEVGALEYATNQFRVVSPRTDLIREGDQPGPLIVILDGWACRYKLLPTGTRQIMAFLMPGDACDLHIGMLDQMDHSIQTLTPAHVALVPGATVKAMMSDHPGIARAMYVSQLIDEGTLRAWLVSLGRRSSVERLSHLLLELYLRGVRVGVAGDDAMDFPFPQIMLADALGMTAVHINRVLQELRRAGAIELRRGVLRLLKPAMLTQIAGFDDSYLHRRLAEFRKNKAREA